MAIELYWDNDEQNIMLCVFDKGWTWDEMFDTLNKVKKVTHQRDYEIGAIIDISAGLSIPGGSVFNADTRAKARKMLEMGGDSKGPIAIAGANGMIKTVAQAFSMMDKNVMNDVYFANDLDEARRIMHNRLKVAAEATA